MIQKGGQLIYSELIAKIFSPFVLISHIAFFVFIADEKDKFLKIIINSQSEGVWLIALEMVSQSCLFTGTALNGDNLFD